MTNIIKMKFGSHVYGTAIPESDVDIKFIFQPDAESILSETPSQHQQNERDNNNKNTNEDIDMEGFSLRKYLFHLAEGQTFALDMLFTPEQYWLTTPSPIWFHILENKHRVISKKTNAFVGYCRAQFTKYCVKSERLNAVSDTVALLQKFKPKVKLELYRDELLTLSLKHPKIIILGDMFDCCGRKSNFHARVEIALDVYTRLMNTYGERTKKASDKNSVDWKALYHAVRVAREAEELLLTGKITLPRPEAPLLLEIRKGLLTFDNINDLIEDGLNKVEAALLQSTLQDLPDYKFINSLVFQANLREVAGKIDENISDRWTRF